MYRSHTCNDLKASHEGSEVTLSGWVHRRRDHGGLIFIDLRDRYGLTQVVFDPSNNQEAVDGANKVRPEYVIKITGVVRKRPEGMKNSKIGTGEIEVLAHYIEVLNKSETPPFEIDSDGEVSEELRLKYRYLDLRKERMKRNILLRHKVIKTIRDFLSDREFVEIETPILIKGTPEGSREYLVPSRLYPGKFFVLPQSPQQLKQLLMVAGMDKYFQIARCFRDEDQRGDRQPEFTQLDMEMSFIEEEDILKVNEECMIHVMQTCVPDKKIQQIPFPRMTWEEAMNDYGSDKPDVRFEMKLADVSEIAKGCGFQVFSKAVSEGGVVKILRVPGAGTFSRKDIEDLEAVAKVYGAHGLAYIYHKETGLESNIVKFFSEDEQKALIEKSGSQVGDLLLFGAGEFEVTCTALGQVRLACGRKLKLMDDSIFAFVWVTDFPLFEWSAEEGRLVSAHHPFTSPKLDQLDMLDTDPRNVKAKAYDLALNGSEVAGGSIRIFNPELQSKIFTLLGITGDEAESRFGHMLKAFQFGAPPHGGIAWGLDRVIMICCEEPNIREVIAFPKDQKAKDLMLNAPSEMPEAQVAEMHVQIKLPKTA